MSRSTPAAEALYKEITEPNFTTTECIALCAFTATKKFPEIIPLEVMAGDHMLRNREIAKELFLQTCCDPILKNYNLQRKGYPDIEIRIVIHLICKSDYLPFLARWTREKFITQELCMRDCKEECTAECKPESEADKIDKIVELIDDLYQEYH